MSDNRMPETPDIRSGFIALSGRPNAGKSTLLNFLTGQHLAIVTPKPQTTRGKVIGILNEPESQMIFVDTPGLHGPKNRLGRHMLEVARRAASDADVVTLLVDAKKPGPTETESTLLRQCRQAGIPVLLLLNKVDAVDKESLLPIMARYNDTGMVTEIIPVSAKTGDGVDRFLDAVRRRLPFGPRYYPESAYTDQTERQLVAELIREQVLLLTEQEIPHGVGVRIEEFEEIGKEDAPDERERAVIRALVYCEKDSHKKILVGKKGQMLKRIGTEARLRIEEMTDCPVYLDLRVIVRSDWRNRSGILQDLGYRG